MSDHKTMANTEYLAIMSSRTLDNSMLDTIIECDGYNAVIGYQAIM